MPAIITNKFRIHNQEQFVESFSESSANVYYMGIGRPQAWTTSTRGDSRTQYEGTDASPLTPVDSISQEFHTFDDLLAAKRVTSSDVSVVIPRRNWTTGTVYDYYRHDYGHYITGSTSSVITADSGATALYDATFYVLNSNNNVYKCLDNNSGANSNGRAYRNINFRIIYRRWLQVEIYVQFISCSTNKFLIYRFYGSCHKFNSSSGRYKRCFRYCKN